MTVTEFIQPLERKALVRIAAIAPTDNAKAAMVYYAKGVNSTIVCARIAADVKISSIRREAPFDEANKRKNLTFVPVGVAAPVPECRSK